MTAKVEVIRLRPGRTLAWWRRLLVLVVPHYGAGCSKHGWVGVPTVCRSIAEAFAREHRAHHGHARPRIRGPRA